MGRLVALTRALALSVALTLAREGEARAESPPGVATADYPIRVDAIEIKGLQRTQPYVVRRELGFKEGDVIDRDAIELATTRLHNTTIFGRVMVDIVPQDGKNVIVVMLEDRWTLKPVIRFALGGEAFYFRVGAVETNLLGEFLEAQASYEYFQGFHGGLLTFRQPRLFGLRLELITSFDHLIRPRQGFADQRTRAALETAGYIDRDRIRFGFRGSAFSDRYLPPIDSPPFPQPRTQTLLFEPNFRLGRIDTVDIRQEGVSFSLVPGLGFTTSSVASTYASMTGELTAFAMLGERWNLAGRVLAATITDVPPHLQLWAGGLDFIRGFPDNYVRSRAYALTNAEVRFTAFETTWLALMPAVFVDAIGARTPMGSVGTAVSTGGGVRFLVPRLVYGGVRVDFGIPIYSTLAPVTLADEARYGPTTPSVNLGKPSLSIGVYQFF